MNTDNCNRAHVGSRTRADQVAPYATLGLEVYQR